MAAAGGSQNERAAASSARETLCHERPVHQAGRSPPFRVLAASSVIGRALPVSVREESSCTYWVLELPFLCSAKCCTIPPFSNRGPSCKSVFSTSQYTQECCSCPSKRWRAKVCLARRGQTRSRRRRGRKAPGLSLPCQANILFSQFRPFNTTPSAIASAAAKSTVLSAVRLVLRLHFCVRRSTPLCPERGLHLCSRRRNGAVAGTRPGSTSYRCRRQRISMLVVPIRRSRCDHSTGMASRYATCDAR